MLYKNSDLQNDDSNLDKIGTSAHKDKKIAIIIDKPATFIIEKLRFVLKKLHLKMER